MATRTRTRRKKSGELATMATAIESGLHFFGSRDAKRHRRALMREVKERTVEPVKSATRATMRKVRTVRARVKRRKSR